MVRVGERWWGLAFNRLDGEIWLAFNRPSINEVIWLAFKSAVSFVSVSKWSYLIGFQVCCKFCVSFGCFKLFDWRCKFWVSFGYFTVTYLRLPFKNGFLCEEEGRWLAVQAPARGKEQTVRTRRQDDHEINYILVLEAVYVFKAICCSQSTSFLLLLLGLCVSAIAG